MKKSIARGVIFCICVMAWGLYFIRKGRKERNGDLRSK